MVRLVSSTPKIRMEPENHYITTGLLKLVFQRFMLRFHVDPFLGVSNSCTLDLRSEILARQRALNFHQAHVIPGTSSECVYLFFDLRRFHSLIFESADGSLVF